MEEKRKYKKKITTIYLDTKLRKWIDKQAALNNLNNTQFICYVLDAIAKTNKPVHFVKPDGEEYLNACTSQ